MTDVVTGWSCPNCNYKAFIRLDDGRKQCSKCREIFGVPAERTIPVKEPKSRIDWSHYNMFAKTNRGNTMRLRHFGK